MNRYIKLVFLFASFGCSSGFDRDLWLENRNSDYNNPRFDMVKDLEKNYLRRDMNRSEIVKLLGAPSNDTIDNRYDLTYEIGSNPGLHMDTYFLVFKLDSMGQLISFRTEGY